MIKKNERLLITGRGFGHGVGASQWECIIWQKKVITTRK